MTEENDDTILIETENDEHDNVDFKKEDDTKDPLEIKTTKELISEARKSNKATAHGCATRSTLKKLRESFREIILYSNATPIRQWSGAGSGFECCFCSKQSVDPAELKQHNIDEHRSDYKDFMRRVISAKFYAKLDITSLHCKLCEESIDSIEALVDHLNSVHDKKISSTVHNNIFPFKFNDVQLRCCICNTTFHVFKALQEHMHLHFPNFICKFCTAGFITEFCLKLHENSHSTEKHKCSYCEKIFNTKLKRNHHEQYKHKDTRRAKCGVCDERFKAYSDKQKHLLEVHGIGKTNEECQACNKTFKNRKVLKQHVKRFHLMMRRHNCKECDMSFYSTNELKKHMTKHTGEKSYQCDVCFKYFARQYTLTEHMRTHFDDRRFSCKLCGRLFVQKCNLKGHMRSHH